MTKKDLTISEAFERLEKITQEFENGEIELDSGIPKFKEGLELAKYLKERLEELKNEIIEVRGGALADSASADNDGYGEVSFEDEFDL